MVGAGVVVAFIVALAAADEEEIGSVLVGVAETVTLLGGVIVALDTAALLGEADGDGVKGMLIGNDDRMLGNGMELLFDAIGVGPGRRPDTTDETIGRRPPLADE